MIKQFINLDGSNADNMINFANKYNNVKQIRLEDNFRSTKGIVDIADRVIQNNVNRLPKKMISNKEIDNSQIKAIKYTNEEEQYIGIADKILELNQMGIPYNDIAILVRKGKYINRITPILDIKNISYNTDSAEYFFEGIYFEKFVNTLQLLTNFSKNELYDCWKNYIDIEKFNDGFKYLRKIVNGTIQITFLSEILKKYLEIVGFLKETALDIDIRRDSLNGIIDILNDYDEIYKDFQLSGKVKGLIDFLDRDAIEQYKYHNFKDKDKNYNAIQILTIHKSKGLEYNTIFIPNLEDNEFPTKKLYGKKYWHVLGEYFVNNKEKYESDIEDERKLFYVAVTRAKENLFLSYEFSKESLSKFVIEATKSDYLDIDKNDLIEQPTRTIIKSRGNSNSSIKGDSKKMDKIIKDAIRKVKREKIDDLYAASHFVGGGAYLEAEDIRNMTDEEFCKKYKTEINKELQKNGVFIV